MSDYDLLLVKLDSTLEIVETADESLLLVDADAPAELLIERYTSIDLVETFGEFEILEIAEQGPPGPPAETAMIERLIAAALSTSDGGQRTSQSVLSINSATRLIQTQKIMAQMVLRGQAL